MKVKGELFYMKQTKKLTRNQRIYLEKKHGVDTSKARLVEETKEYIAVQIDGGVVIRYDKEVQ